MIGFSKPPRKLFMVMAASLAGWLPVAYAHGVHLFATEQTGTIKGEAYFTGGSPVKQGQVEIRSTDNRLVGKAELNEQGRFSYVAEPGDYRLVLNPASGHRAEMDLHIGAEKDTGKREQRPQTAAGADEGPPEHGAQGGRISEKELRNVVSSAVKTEVAALRRDLNKRKARIRFRDMLGGIGWIIGLLGIWFFLRGKYGRNTSE